MLQKLVFCVVGLSLFSGCITSKVNTKWPVTTDYQGKVVATNNPEIVKYGPITAHKMQLKEINSIRQSGVTTTDIFDCIGTRSNTKNRNEITIRWHYDKCNSNINGEPQQERFSKWAWEYLVSDLGKVNKATAIDPKGKSHNQEVTTREPVFRLPKSGFRIDDVMDEVADHNLIVRWRYKGLTNYKGRKALFFQIGGEWTYNFRLVATIDNDLGGYGLIDAKSGAVLYEEYSANQELSIGGNPPAYRKYSYRWELTPIKTESN